MNIFRLASHLFKLIGPKRVYFGTEVLLFTIFGLLSKPRNFQCLYCGNEEQPSKIACCPLLHESGLEIKLIQRVVTDSYLQHEAYNVYTEIFIVLSLVNTVKSLLYKYVTKRRYVLHFRRIISFQVSTGIITSRTKPDQASPCR